MNCVFCAISKKQAPAHVIYEDEQVIVFLDTNPLAQGHCLVAPKEHAENLFDISEEVLARITSTTKFLAKHMQTKLGAEGVNLLHASGKAAQQSVQHFHIHVVPRFAKDDYDLWPRTTYHEEDLAATAKKLLS